MGRLFTYEQIDAGKVPEPTDFDDARDLFVVITEDAIEEGEILGSFVYGSVALGMANRRSDFDSFITLPDRGKNHLENARRLVGLMQHEVNPNIPINPIVHAKPALTSGRHEMDRFFGQHLMSNFRLVRGEDPADYMKFAGHRAETIISDYLDHKRRVLTATYVSDDPLNIEEGGGIQRMLELPPAVGRKVLQALVEVGYITNAVESTADKMAVLRKTKEVFEQLDVDYGFMEIHNYSRHYDALLADAIRGNVSKTEYDKAIEELHSSGMPMAIAWLERLEDKVLPLLY